MGFQPESSEPETEPVGPSGEGGSSRRRMGIAGEGFEFHNYFEILINTANWLIKKGKLRASDCPIVMGPQRNLVNTQPKHRFGNDFVAAKKLSNGLWIETHLSASGCMSTARKLLGRFGYSPGTLVIEQ